VADWLQEYREELWDKQIEADAKAGKLDSLIKKAKAGYRAGKATPLSVKSGLGLARSTNRNGFCAGSNSCN
jgi:hypothetical protein